MARSTCIEPHSKRSLGICENGLIDKGVDCPWVNIWFAHWMHLLGDASMVKRVGTLWCPPVGAADRDADWDLPAWGVP